MDLVSLINKHKNKIFNIVLIIIAMFFASNIYKKQAASIKSIKAEIAKEEKRNQTLDSIGKLDAQINAYRKLLVKKEPSSSINEINNIARDSGIKIVSIKPAGEDSLVDYKKYNFDLTVSSPDYDTLARFINALEVNQSVYNVDLLDIRSPSRNKKSELSASLRISAVAIVE